MMKVFELYSGIGGMHFALKESGINAEVFRAIDINTTANSVYTLNFPQTVLLEKNVQCLCADDFNNNNVSMILMSPPCQPYTRNGFQKDKSDTRSDSLIYLLTLLPKLKTINYILIENVKGFEVSEVRNELVEILKNTNFIYQEFLLTPVQFAIPNSRLRYYLLAKRTPLKFCFSPENSIKEILPILRNDVQCEITKIAQKYQKLVISNQCCYPIGLILDKDSDCVVPDNILKKYGTLFDVVTSESLKSCCFTKGYGHYVEGTGSVLSPHSAQCVKKVFEKLGKNNCKGKSMNDSPETLNLLKSLELRYFTPKEILRLMSFPEDFNFPSQLSNKQKYRLLGNSVNVHIVSILIRILCS